MSYICDGNESNRIAKLVKDFNSLGIQHPDDMSTIIMVSAYRALNNKPIRMKQQIKFYKNYWEKQLNRT